MSIFGSAAGSGALGSTSGNRHSLEFKAGRMNLVDSDQGGAKKKMIHPDNRWEYLAMMMQNFCPTTTTTFASFCSSRKGLLYIYSADDGWVAQGVARDLFSTIFVHFRLTHFCWKDRSSGTVEDDLIVFPDDCEFKKVDQCKDGRVFMLKFKSSNRKLFFWLQEPTNEKDEEYCRRVNELLNNPPSSGGSGGSGGARGEGSDLQYMLNNMSQQQLMQLFGGVGQMGGLSSLLGSINRTGSNRNSSSTPTSARSAAAAGATAVVTPANTTQPATPRAPKKDKNSSGDSSDTTTSAALPALPEMPSDTSRVLLSELQNYLAGINTGASGSKHNVDLSTSLNSESINSILSDPERLTALSAHLPNIDEEGKPLEAGVVKQQLKDTLASPQFQQALSMFSNALQSGQLGPVVSQFKLNDDAVSAANSGDLEQFVKALEKASIKDSSAKDDEKPEDKANDE